VTLSEEEFLKPSRPFLLRNARASLRAVVLQHQGFGNLQSACGSRISMVAQKQRAEAPAQTKFRELGIQPEKKSRQFGREQECVDGNVM
jgi:hypothetical protein